MAIKIALAGNPNSGKTTMFNDLTGSNQYVGNWPGVTVEKKEGKLKGAEDIIIQDLPGIYSLSPYTLEEVVARSYLVNEKPDAILNIVDATNIERNLYLTTQLAELGIPMVIALNMIDVSRKNGDVIDLKRLGAALGCEVVETSALKGMGSKEVAQKAAALAAKRVHSEPPHVFAGSVEHALAHIEDLITHRDGQEAEHHHHADGSVHAGSIVPEHLARWYAIKLFERDEKVLAGLNLPSGIKDAIEQAITACETEMDDDAESIITNQRYAYINKLVTGCVKKGRKRGALTTSDKIDRIVTNRWLGLPIFVAVMWFVYYVSVQTIGDILTNFTNDVFVAEWIQTPVMEWLSSIGTADWLVGLIGDGIIGGVGAVIGFVPQMLVLFILLAILEDVGYMARVAFIMDRIFRKFGLSGKSFIPMLIASGCGVPGVMASRTIEQDRDRKMTIMTTTFIPCGAKMPIVALIAGALFHNSGWVSTGAYFIGVAAVIMSGILLKKTKPFAGDPAPFVMELPAYHTPAAGNVLRSMWERGWSFIKRAGTVILLSSIFIWLTSSYGWAPVVEGTPVDGAAEETVLADADAETDETAENAAITSYVFGAVENSDESILGHIGSTVAPVFRPLGFGNWQSTVATVMGLVAKEEVVSTFGVLYGVTDEAGEDAAMGIVEDGGMSADEMAEALSPIAQSFDESSNGHGQLAAFSFLLFNLLCAPCFAAMGAIKREMNNAKWTLFAIGYQCVLAYGVSLVVYQLGLLFSGAGFGVATAVAILLVALLAYLVLRKNRYDENHLTQKVKVQA
ncbi:MAG TPA: ferrous iron transport protein B [Candidatus Alectryocaccomicrobium excrementavium]|uniref:Ferrous iron transport protein B n=1 Tax=Candidatus Alectryocaccomicrobium excrementavium TaxID=2840668 RepID=A0A9D1FZ22_9FIRM|nr:ferrous iron transport protein B [Candidatus Alectryocaccomicrobium excrementavium]